MASQRVAAERSHVGGQHECTQPDSKGSAAGCWISEPEGAVHVVDQHNEKAERDVEEISVNVLQDQRKRGLAAVLLAGFPNRTGRRIGPERLVVRATIVVARQPKESGKGQDQEGRGEYPPVRPPVRLRSKPRVRRAAEQLGGIEGRGGRTGARRVALEWGPG